MENCPIRITILILISLILSACSLPGDSSVTREQAQLDYNLLFSLPEKPVSFYDEVKPILDKRCVVCHGCYDAPCQLKLSSIEGIQRGATKEKLYDGKRILASKPTRLFIDAKTPEQWRAKDFYPVLNENNNNLESNLIDSVMYKMLRLKQRHPQPRVGMLSDRVDTSLDRKQSCPTSKEFNELADEHPLWGMPYAMPNLSEAEYKTLTYWIAQGSPVEKPSVLSAVSVKEIKKWEKFLNGNSNKEKLVSRYLYEHLFLAHIHFDVTADREFYRLVRSTTPTGKSVNEIASIRPFDDPGVHPFYYRFVKINSTIVAKTHLPYVLSNKRMQRYRELFFKPAYKVDDLPTYEIKIASNPIKVFSAIPPESRYRFLLDDARFFIEGFIKGPVCRGQVALNVIEDQFWVVFFDPDKKLFSLKSDFLDKVSGYLQLPTDKKQTFDILSVRNDYAPLFEEYVIEKVKNFKQLPIQSVSTAMNTIWDGDGDNPNAALTIFRHFDSASVRFGLHGNYPDSAWVIDYPLLERIHYLLVAGFNVYGNAGHQLSSRLYMDFLRMEGEDYFLAFLPSEQRKEIRDSWYEGVREIRKDLFNIQRQWLNVDVVTGYKTDDPQQELYDNILQRVNTVNKLDVINRCGLTNCQLNSASSEQQRVDRAMQRITSSKGKRLEVLPDLALLRVSTAKPETDLVYTLIRNKGYKSVTSILEDAEQRDNSDLENDTLTVIKGIEGTYPNFFFTVDINEIENFADRYLKITNRYFYEKFVARYGVRRTNPKFWQVSDGFQNYYADKEPLVSGILDLNRYNNR